jgi:hypothetical protein
MKGTSKALAAGPIEPRIFTVRGQKVILDSDLALIYGVPTYRFNEAVKRNKDRFPEDFRFQLTKGEADSLTSQFAISKPVRRWSSSDQAGVTERKSARRSRKDFFSGCDLGCHGPMSDSACLLCGGLTPLRLSERSVKRNGTAAPRILLVILQRLCVGEGAMVGFTVPRKAPSGAQEGSPG